MLITTLVVSFYKDGRDSVSVKLWFLVGTLRSPYTTEHYDHHTQQNITITTHNRTLRSPHTQQNGTITTHNRTLRSPHTTERYDHHTQQNTTITTHNRTLRSPHITERYDHHTQQNTTITTHKGSQLLKLTETRYQVQPTDKKLHTEDTPLRTTILH